MRPDLILADVMMPNLDGFALLRAIRGDEALKHTPVILLTARTGEDSAIEGLVAGADDYLAKPFSARELIARVGGQIVLSRARRHTEALNAFLGRFSASVRGLTEPRAMAQAACRMIRDQLGVDSAHWAEIDGTTREYVVIDSALPPGRVPLERRFALAAWEPFTALHLQGRSVAVDDVKADRRLTAPVRKALARTDIRAILTAPVVVDGVLRSVLCVSQPTVRHWSSDETALVESVAGRCRAEVERARGEAAALQAERRAEAILERMGDAHCVLDREFRIVGMNAAAERLLGQPRAALLGRSHWEAFPASVDAPVGRAFRCVVEQGVEQHLAHHYTGEGYDLHLELDAYPTEAGGVAMFWRDVTERVRAETALPASEERMRRQNDALQAVVPGAPVEESLNVLARMVAAETAGEARTVATQTAALIIASHAASS